MVEYFVVVVLFDDFVVDYKYYLVGYFVGKVNFMGDYYQGGV